MRGLEAAPPDRSGPLFAVRTAPRQEHAFRAVGSPTPVTTMRGHSSTPSRVIRSAAQLLLRRYRWSACVSGSRPPLWRWCFPCWGTSSKLSRWGCRSGKQSFRACSDRRSLANRRGCETAQALGPDRRSAGVLPGPASDNQGRWSGCWGVALTGNEGKPGVRRSLGTGESIHVSTNVACSSGDRRACRLRRALGAHGTCLEWRRSAPIS